MFMKTQSITALYPALAVLVHVHTAAIHVGSMVSRLAVCSCC